MPAVAPAPGITSAPFRSKIFEKGGGRCAREEDSGEGEEGEDEQEEEEARAPLSPRGGSGRYLRIRSKRARPSWLRPTRKHAFMAVL